MAADGVRLSDIIAPAFYPVHWDLVDSKHTYYNLYGGRGSTKSSFIGTEIVLGIISDPLANALVYRKIGNTIANSVFEQVLWSIEALGMSHLWKERRSPFSLTFTPTGQTIIFRGLDKAKKVKSIKIAHGYFKYLWFEELDEFSGDEEIRSVQQSVLRGGEKFVVFKSFNPPISKSNWANQYVLTPRKDALNHKSCYLDVPPAWLGQQFFEDAEFLRQTNPRAYEHEYMGEAIGNGGEVFDNIVSREITDREIQSFDRIYMGIDWGWYPDPFHWAKMHYDSARLTLYIFDEYRANKQSNQTTWEALRTQKGVTGNDLITADSAEPKSVGDYASYGAMCRPAVKGPDSVRYGIKWLQSLKAIVIDPVRCPATAKEFSSYEYDRTATGEVMSGYPDVDNHSIDAVRYAMERVWKRKGQ